MSTKQKVVGSSPTGNAIFDWKPTGKYRGKPPHPRDIRNAEGGPAVSWTDTWKDPVIDEVKRIAREKLRKGKI